MFERILICSLLSIVNFFLIVFIRNIFIKHSSTTYQSFIWIGLIINLCIAFIPSKMIGQYLNTSLFPQEESQFLYNNLSNNVLLNHYVGEDLYESVQRFDFSMVLSVLEIIWIVGLCVGCFIFLFEYIRLLCEKKHYQRPTKEMIVQFDNLKKRLKMKRSIRLYVKSGKFSPYSFGVFRPIIVVPDELIKSFSQKDIEYILIHEVIHIKHFDTLLNLILYGLKIFYWFHPIVWIAFQQMRLDREIYCDNSIMKLLSENERLSYGHTILGCVEYLHNTSTSFINYFASSHHDITERIHNIIRYSKDTVFERMKCFLSIILIICIVYMQIPIVETYANDNHDDNSLYEIEAIDLSSYFQGYEGTFVLFDTSLKKYDVYNESLARERFAPNSTYKIIDALLNLENGTINEREHDLKWDGTHYPFETWQQNHNIYSAMKNSVNWYFQNLDKKTGKQKIKKFLEEINYGNKMIGNSLDTYWLESTLKISPLEQVRVLKSVFENKFHFNENNIELVKNSIFINQIPKGSLYGKTGTGRINGQNVNGWFIGYMDQGDKQYYFSTYIKGKDNVGGKIAADITMNILNMKK